MKTFEGTLENTKLSYSTLYITSIYYIITTLSTVGYGDSVGTTEAEYIFQMLVMVRPTDIIVRLSESASSPTSWAR